MAPNFWQSLSTSSLLTKPSTYKAVNDDDSLSVNSGSKQSHDSTRSATQPSALRQALLSSHEDREEASNDGGLFHNNTDHEGSPNSTLPGEGLLLPKLDS